jgi:hypothetical protein
MTKKDFEAIADILIMHNTHATQADMNSLIRETCTVLKRGNDRFDEDKFLVFIKKRAAS